MWNHQRSLLDLRDFLFGSLATYLCADALFNRTNHQTLSPHLKQWPLNLKPVNRWNQSHVLTVLTTVNGLIVSPPVFGPLISGWLQGLLPLNTKRVLFPPMQRLQLLRSAQGSQLGTQPMRGQLDFSQELWRKPSRVESKTLLKRLLVPATRLPPNIGGTKPAPSII